MLYDIIIIGSGPAGLSAGLYAGRYNRNTLLIQGPEPGGQALTAWIVENYPGVPKINGAELVNKMEEQAKAVGVEIVAGSINAVNQVNQCFDVAVDDKIYQGKSLIFAAGTHRRKLGLPNEEELTGKGVAYCATCDGAFFRGKRVAVIGGSDSSVKSTILLDQYASELYLITRREKVMGEPINMEHLKKTKTQVITNNTVTQLLEKDGLLSGVHLSQPYNGQDILPLDGLFIEVGGVPNTALLKPLHVAMDPHGFIKVNEDMTTNVSGLFAAGDATTAFDGLKQIITAAASGAAAAFTAHNYLLKHK